jgi:hypothetical protein
LVGVLDGWARRVAVAEPLELLTERALLMGLQRGGTVSCGGTTRLLSAADRPIAVCLARAEDRELLPAWLEVSPETLGEGWPDKAPWEELSILVAQRRAPELDKRAALLGLPVGVPGVSRPRPPVLEYHIGAAPARPIEATTVVDLSSLWAGPLCGALLARMGASVIKVESSTRPDGTSQSSPAFDERLNGAKQRVVLALPEERDDLAAIIEDADVVIEASRPRALAQLGIDATETRRHRPQVWLSITGHGREPGIRVAFGDDAAIAGGLWCSDDHGPVFCVDAIADPATGIAAAAACVDALQQGGRWLLDISMVAVAAALAGPTIPLPPQLGAI